MEDDALPLIGLFYEAAATPALWNRALGALADTLEATDAHIIALEKSTGRPMLAVAGTRGILREFMRPYFGFWASRDPLIPKMVAAPKGPGSLMLSQEYLSRSEVMQSDYFQEFAIPFGVRHQAAWVLQDDPQLHVVVDLIRDENPFEREQLCRRQHVSEHLQRALRLTLQLAEASAQSTRWRQAIDQAGLMCLVVDSAGRLLDQSVAAASSINEDGALRVRGGRLFASTRDETQRLRQQIALAAAGRSGGKLRLACKAGEVLLQVVPAGVNAENPFAPRYSNCALIVMQKRTRRCPPKAAEIRDQLRCTPAEAEIAAALAAGRSPQQIADLRQVSIHTVRTQVRELFARSGTRRIGELVGLIARL